MMATTLGLAWIKLWTFIVLEGVIFLLVFRFARICVPKKNPPEFAFRNVDFQIWIFWNWLNNFPSTRNHLSTHVYVHRQMFVAIHEKCICDRVQTYYINIIWPNTNVVLIDYIYEYCFTIIQYHIWYIII